MSELVQFRNQYTIAKNLEILGIVKPYSLNPYRNGYALIIEDGAISLKHFADGRSLPLEQFLAIGVNSTLGEGTEFVIRLPVEVNG